LAARKAPFGAKVAGVSEELDLARERPYLLGVAYRMLGSASDAEDVVQEALARGTRQRELRSPRAFLTTVVTRLCLDELGSARRRRESYVGPYLPEPVATDRIDGDGEQRESVTLALLIVLDQLTPLERAVFVLRDLFELEFHEIAAALERSEPACRKLLSRARERIAHAEHCPPQPSQTQLEIAHAFFSAIASGDMNRLVELLSEQALLETDHGGKVAAARNTLHGRDQVARFMRGLWVKGERRPGEYRALPALLNGAPAVVLHGASDAVEATFTLEIDGSGRVAAVRVMRNPDKLRALSAALRRGERLALLVR
jgi:RNA polymerase sigma-70 factor, ECF subfamily